MEKVDDILSLGYYYHQNTKTNVPKAGDTMYCKWCGHPVKPGDAFCSVCGHEIVSEETTEKKPSYYDEDYVDYEEYEDPTYEEGGNSLKERLSRIFYGDWEPRDDYDDRGSGGRGLKVILMILAIAAVLVCLYFVLSGLARSGDDEPMVSESPSPSVTATAAPTATVTPTPSASASASPSPSATPTPTPTPTVTPTPTPTATATPAPTPEHTDPPEPPVDTPTPDEEITE